MTPLPSPKNLDDIFDTMNSHLGGLKTLGEIDIFNIRKRFKEVLTSSPAHAYAGLGMLALCTNNESEMRASFERAITCKECKMFVHFNYAVSLQNIGCIEEACDQLQLAAQNCEDVTWLDSIAMIAISIDDIVTMEHVISKAKKLKITGPNIQFAAMHIALSSADTEDAGERIIGDMLTNDVLRKNSSPMTSEEWNHMQKLANELEQYV